MIGKVTNPHEKAYRMSAINRARVRRWADYMEMYIGGKTAKEYRELTIQQWVNWKRTIINNRLKPYGVYIPCFVDNTDVNRVIRAWKPLLNLTKIQYILLTVPRRKASRKIAPIIRGGKKNRIAQGKRRKPRKKNYSKQKNIPLK